MPPPPAPSGQGPALARAALLPRALPRRRHVRPPLGRLLHPAARGPVRAGGQPAREGLVRPAGEPDAEADEAAAPRGGSARRARQRATGGRAADWLAAAARPGLRHGHAAADGAHLRGHPPLRLHDPARRDRRRAGAARSAARHAGEARAQQLGRAVRAAAQPQLRRHGAAAAKAVSRRAGGAGGAARGAHGEPAARLHAQAAAARDDAKVALATCLAHRAAAAPHGRTSLPRAHRRRAGGPRQRRRDRRRRGGARRRHQPRGAAPVGAAPGLPPLDSCERAQGKEAGRTARGGAVRVRLLRRLALPQRAAQGWLAAAARRAVGLAVAVQGARFGRRRRARGGGLVRPALRPLVLLLRLLPPLDPAGRVDARPRAALVVAR
mmetsp:Transcript_45023/g.146251  ORF Transcript_45023/g.146251 Transcript_45023/m.146251 type:complete len:381 (+) Transcript_45023:454-1596(+)